MVWIYNLYGSQWSPLRGASEPWDPALLRKIVLTMDFFIFFIFIWNKFQTLVLHTFCNIFLQFKTEVWCKCLKKVWLCGCEEKNVLFCSVCLLFGSDNNWMNKGVRDFKNLIEKIYKKRKIDFGHQFCIFLIESLPKKKVTNHHWWGL